MKIYRSSNERRFRTSIEVPVFFDVEVSVQELEGADMLMASVELFVYTDNYTNTKSINITTMVPADCNDEEISDAILESVGRAIPKALPTTANFSHFLSDDITNNL